MGHDSFASVILVPQLLCVGYIVRTQQLNLECAHPRAVSGLSQDCYFQMQNEGECSGPGLRSMFQQAI